MTPPEVIAAWSEFTGQKWRLLPCLVQQEAAEFASAEFTREEMRLVIAYTQRMMARGESGFNDQSITWRVMAADRWQKFQERLDAARKTKLARTILPRAKEVTPVPAPTMSPEEEERLRAQGKAAMRKFRERGGA